MKPLGEPVPIARVADQLRALGVREGGVLLVHASYRAVRPVEGGPAGLVEASGRAIGHAGTLVMPAWPADATIPFDPARTPVAPDLGVVADTFRRLPGVERSRHVHAFAARGARAGEVLADPLPLPPHAPASPVGRVHDLDGQVLLLGVDHDADTTIHLAEVVAGVPYGVVKRCLAERAGRPVVIEYRENDHCCRRFRMVGPWLRSEGSERRGPVGHGTARLVRSRAVVSAVVARLRDDPLLFLHEPDRECEECDEARASIA